jgi:hypothetical protein
MSTDPSGPSASTNGTTEVPEWSRAHRAEGG